MKIKIIYISIYTIFCSTLNSQNLDLIGKEKPFRVNGGLSVNQAFYASTDSISRRDPYNYYLSGNLNFSLYGWSIPLTFNYSNHKATYTQPFNNYNLHPQYKWIKLHIGYTSMNFSPYTLNGHLFFGSGAELTPQGPFNVGFMYGRLGKAHEYDSSNVYSLLPEYERWGYGFKAGYNWSAVENLSVKIDVNMFRARDDPGSLKYLPDSMLYPGSNLVVGTTAQIIFAGQFTLSAELAKSAVTKNTLSDLTETGETGLNNILSSMNGPNGTNEYYGASKYNFTHNRDFYTVGVGYERIDPGYETYGAYYFNNDMQNVTLNGSVRLLENKVNASANVGRQNDNLDNTKASEMKRWVNAYNVGFNPNERLSASFSYSTFTSFMNIRSQFIDVNRLTPYDNLDTLNFTQLSMSFSGSVSYVLKNTDQSRQNISFNYNQQNSSEEQNGLDTLGASHFYNISSVYGLSFVPVGLTFSAAVMSSINRMPGMKTSTLGPSLSVNKLMFDKKLRNSVTVSYNTSQAEGTTATRVLSMRYGAGYRLGKRHNFNMGLTMMNRKNKTQQLASVTEFVGNLTYGMSF